MRPSGVATAVAAVAAVALLAAGVWLIYRTPASVLTGQPPRLGATPSGDQHAVIIRVDDGDGAAGIGEKLQDAGVIQSARLFQVLAALMGLEDDLAAGDYEFAPGETALTAVRRISAGITARNIVTVPEGLRAEEIGELLEEHGVATRDEFLRALDDAYDAPFLPSEPLPSGVEGYLFPATYGFSLDTTAHQAVQQMLDAFGERHQERIEPLLGTRSLHDVVILASIVEREAVVPDERPIIASVFANRLASGFPLAADPTIQYALGSDPASVARFGYWKQELTIADLALASPYNTYVNVGLPPGPIANPGLDALLAAASPAGTNFLFFVARPDGSHVFSETLEEHQRNICEIDPARVEC